MNIQDLEGILQNESTKALLWQYNEAKTLESLLQQKEDWYNEFNEDFWNNWIADVFDIETANAFGLTVWSIILNLPLTIGDGEVAQKPTWGFGSLNQNFNNGNFNNVPGNTVNLNTEQARVVLWLRGYQITSSGAIPEINKFLKYLFMDKLQLGKVYAFDNLDMTMSYIFNFEPDQALRFALENLDILPRPSGVEINIQYDPVPGWGFGPFNLNYNNGNFFGS